jgi:hypothetical protein
MVNVLNLQPQEKWPTCPYVPLKRKSVIMVTRRG